jgi:valyl-tRNA synthetase
MTELPKNFEPRAIEDRWYAHWEGRGLFRPERGDATPWTIVMPPPNVTGSLHIGHALDITLQDVLTRRERMRGKDALWVVGTDHAGIATQMVVERQLEERQDKRTNYSREDFVAKVWDWKEESGGAITRQLRRLGASCDWAHERFTMDEGFSKAVAHVFVELYKRGLAYRDKRLVNWDPKFQTAISDLEVETRDVQGKFWTLRYPLADGGGAIEVATTRPETMLADMAVAVHPGDERYTALIGKQIKHPITGRLIPIVADEHADPELGSGAVKITPGHDFNDFEVGKCAGFKAADMLNMFDALAKVVQTADGLIPEAIVGLSREEARTRVVELLEAEGALVRVEDRVIPTPYGDRSGVVIEPWLTDQWYVDAATLVKPVIEATRSGKIKIVPKSWEKTWFNWLENIQPWCVSRQLWWGHRIPAWFGAKKEAYESTEGGAGYYTAPLFAYSDGHAVVSETEDDVRKQFAEYYGVSPTNVKILEASSWETREHGGPDRYVYQDQDVLDTWFSSALWPFATLGWPDAPPRDGEVAARSADGGGPTHANPLHHPADGPPPRSGEDLARHYPNDVLISGFDILFFWDARMAMQGIEFMGEPPWKTLYLHGLVRDAAGQKMSKSKGNTVDPLGLIDKYGADALRFTLAAMESQGRDIKLDEKRVEGYRNFATKLWNAARFLQMNGVGASDSIAAPSAELPVNRWIIGEVVETLAKLDRAFDELRYDEMADAIYHFVWGTFCDWYVELIKGELTPTSVRAEPVEALSLSSQEQDSPSTSSGRTEKSGAEETRRVAAWAFDQILVMLHPLMPFITEELWNANERPHELIVAKWPEPEAQVDANAKAEIEWLIRLVSEVRAGRTELNVPPKAKPSLIVEKTSDATLSRLQDYAGSIERLARCVYLPEALGDYVPGGSMQFSVDDTDYVIPLEGVIDVAAERARLAKAAAAAEQERDALLKRLDNPAFLERAKPDAVEKAKSDYADKESEAFRLRAALERLG